MKKLVLCVPNFSEGRDPSIIGAITDRIESVDGVKLLDVDPGQATNRTVVTFVGSPDAVIDAAVGAAEIARDLIDMTSHVGEHPRASRLPRLARARYGGVRRAGEAVAGGHRPQRAR